MNKPTDGWIVFQGHMHEPPKKFTGTPSHMVGVYEDRDEAIKSAISLPTLRGKKFKYKPYEGLPKDGHKIWYWYGPPGEYVSVTRVDVHRGLGGESPKPKSPKKEKEISRWDQL